MAKEICVNFFRSFVIISVILKIFTNDAAIASPMRDFSLENDEITSRPINVNNPEDQGILERNFNLTPELLSRINSLRTSSLNATPTIAPNLNNTSYTIYRKEDIKSKIENAIRGLPQSNEGNFAPPQHEMAAYPICIPDTTELSWQQDNNITLRFAAHLFEDGRQGHYLDTALLRLFKRKVNQNPEDSPNDSAIECSDPKLDAQIRITISIVQHLKRNKRGRTEEKKKLICNSMMLNASETGWVTIDVRRAIHIWGNAAKHQKNNNNNNRYAVIIGLLVIEVHDEEERAMKPGAFFEPPKCSQADFAIPWNLYRRHEFVASSGLEKMPRNPRLDMKLVGNRRFNGRLRHPRPAFNFDHLYHTNNSPDLNSLTVTATPSTFQLTVSNNFVELTNKLSPLANNRLHSHKKRHAQHHQHKHQHHLQDQDANAEKEIEIESNPVPELDC